MEVTQTQCEGGNLLHGWVGATLPKAVSKQFDFI